MKNKAIFLFILSIILFTNCNKETFYNYSISEVKWLDKDIDKDGDEYFVNKTLSLKVSILEDVTTDIKLVAYTRLETTEDWIFYKSQTLEGFSEEVNFEFSFGTDPQLAYGKYDIMFELYEIDSEVIRLTTLNDSSITNLSKLAFERLVDDYIFDINISWADSIDQNDDGYLQEAKLFTDVNIDGDETKEIYLKLFKKEVSETEYTYVTQTSPFTISGSEMDTTHFVIGAFPDSLTHGIYDFQIRVYETDDYFPVVIYDSDMSDLLNDRPFETKRQDGFFYTIKQSALNWSNEIDNDGDDYTSSRTLTVDVNVDKDVDRDIFIKIYKYSPSDTTYFVLDSTDVFTINGKSSDDAIDIIVTSTDSVALDSANYSFLIEVFENLPPGKRVTEATLDSVNVLLDRLFETPTQDTP